MSKARDRMRQAYDQKTEPAAQSQPLTPAPMATKVKEKPKSERPPAPPPQKPARKQQVQHHADTPTAVQMIAREDLPLDTYGIKPVATNFGCYNRDLWKWLKDFSSDNQFNGGVPITKSQLMEICLDVVMYDLAIEPIGYNSHQELREAIQNRIGR